MLLSEVFSWYYLNDITGYGQNQNRMGFFHNFYLLELFYGFMNHEFTNYSLEQFVYSLLPKCKNLGYSYILCTDTQDYKYMLDKLGFKKKC